MNEVKSDEVSASQWENDDWRSAALVLAASVGAVLEKKIRQI